jgi:predicted transport protein
MFFLIFDFIFSKLPSMALRYHASDLQTFIGVKEMTSVVDGEVKKQKGAFKYDLFELKLEFLQELESFVKDVSIFGVISVGKVQYNTSLTTGAELQPYISQPQLTRKTTEVNSFYFHGHHYFL